MAKAATYTNRLAKEKSPYLLQHAHNPVDWYPWGEEALEKARKEDKPIFLSIGYSTCHWCHVMEEESFEKETVAQVMNQNFVAVKVDREERPDLDNVYMTAVQAMTGSGGWPLNVFITAEGKPFFGGTYWPPESRWGQPGFVDVLGAIAKAWKNHRGQILEQGDHLTTLLQQNLKARAQASISLSSETLDSAYHQLHSFFDDRHGGFGGPMKFPRTHTLSFLLRCWKKFHHQEALQMVEKTLEEMRRGGIWDHLGGGFHRYATDLQWFLPHFEKMLYDQALISKTYLEAYQASGKPEYAQTVREIFDYVLRDLRDPAGAFYSAEDADSLDPASPSPLPPGERESLPAARLPARQGQAGVRGKEGAFYVWKKQEVLDLLGEKNGEVFSLVYGISSEGNVSSDPHGEFPLKNVLFLAHSPEEAAKKFNLPLSEIQKILERSKEALLETRAKRPRPHRDDKILADWNGLMISSLAFGSRVLEDERYLEAAQKAADFVLAKMIRHDGRLLHRYRDQDAAILASIDDYAFLIHGLIDLYEASFEVRYLAEAKKLCAEMIRLFWDEASGGFFFTAEDAEKLITRQKEIYDGAVPSGNSLAALDLLRLGRLTMDKNLSEKAAALFAAFSDPVSQNPEAYPYLLIALDFALGPSKEIVIAGKRDGNFSRILRLIYSRFLPNRVLAFHSQDSKEKKPVEALVPFMKNQNSMDGKNTIYVCENYSCKFPVTEISALEKLLA